jgi:hypothetical protein
MSDGIPARLVGGGVLVLLSIAPAAAQIPPPADVPASTASPVPVGRRSSHDQGTHGLDRAASGVPTWSLPTSVVREPSSGAR